MKTITFTQAEARRTDGALCWKPRHNGPVIYGKGCTLPRDHWLEDTPHRFNGRIKADPMPKSRLVRIIAIGLTTGAVVELAAQWAVSR